MSKFEELLKKHCADGVEWKNLGDVSEIKSGRNKIKNETGKYPVYGSTGIIAYSDDYVFDKPHILIARVGVNAGYIHIADGLYDVSDNTLIITELNSDIYFKYMYYILINARLNNYIKGGGIPLITAGEIKNISIPIPPIEIQKEIVRILDTFTKYQDLLNKELELRKKQYEYYRDKLLTFGDEVEYKTVGDVGLVTKLAGFEFTKYVTYSNKGKIIALRGLNVKNGRLNLDEVKYIDESDLTKLTRSKLYIDDMLFTYVGTIGEVALIDKNDKYYLAPNVALIRFDKKIILPKFMIYYFQSNIFFNTQINKLLQSSSMKNIPMEKIRKFLVPIPPLEEQERIVKILDQFDTLCNDITRGLPAEIELRKKQYEYYRDKLLTFKEKKK
ncbi:restriction endonuclease subunit S [Brachyspira sp. SAP_772]|uniref:restriction endonuclease subunit S n=1 Tax=Brachyspira sp. SAP_772 TaxID=2608385 RepID=UPI0012F4B3BD|nr:restriction endonuclease subunit S [Brachyspira sp. SAP_772]